MRKANAPRPNRARQRPMRAVRSHRLARATRDRRPTPTPLSIAVNKSNIVAVSRYLCNGGCFDHIRRRRRRRHQRRVRRRARHFARVGSTNTYEQTEKTVRNRILWKSWQSCDHDLTQHCETIENKSLEGEKATQTSIANLATMACYLCTNRAVPIIEPNKDNVIENYNEQTQPTPMRMPLVECRADLAARTSRRRSVMTSSRCRPMLTWQR
jgi:hypothetical protein